MTPTYRGSELDAFATCPFKFACGLLRAANNKCTTDAEIAAYLSAYCCPEGVAYILANCGSTPMPLQSRMTAIGIQFHAFAHAYGTHLKRNRVASDWEAADQIARGMATVNGDFVKAIYDAAVFWYQQFEHNPQTFVPQKGDVDLRSGSFERGHQVTFRFGDREGLYVMHPDFAKLSADLKRLTVMDWKSGLRGDVYDSEKPDKQLLRYAWAFSKRFPTITEAELHLVFVNPKHPLSDEPLVWVRDLQEFAIPDDVVTAAVSAIAASPEFRPNVGCWLCDGYCEWALYCPEGDAAHMVLDVDPQTALEAYRARQETYKLSRLLSQKRAHLMRVVDAHVDQYGPLVVGQDADGNDITYGPKKKVVASVRDTVGLVHELEEMGRPDLVRKLKLEDARGFAEDAGMKKPFRDHLLENVKLTWRVGNNVDGVDEDEDVEVDAEEAPPRRVLPAVDYEEQAEEPGEFADVF